MTEVPLTLAAHELSHVAVNLEFGATTVEVKRDPDGFTVSPFPIVVSPDAIAAGMIAGVVGEIIFADDLDPVGLFHRGGLTALFGACQHGEDDQPIAVLIFSSALPHHQLEIVERTTEIVRDRLTISAVHTMAEKMSSMSVGASTRITESAFAAATHSAPTRCM